MRNYIAPGCQFLAGGVAVGKGGLWKEQEAGMVLRVCSPSEQKLAVSWSRFNQTCIT